MVLIDYGKMRMGRIEGVQQNHLFCGNNEPKHTVLIEHPYAMSKDEITVREFALFVLRTSYRTVAEQGITQLRRLRTRPGKIMDSGCIHGPAFPRNRNRLEVGYSWRNPGYPSTDDHAVVCVSKADAVAYAAWLAEETGEPYRLPSEAEWEYAARGMRSDSDLRSEALALQFEIEASLDEDEVLSLPGPVGLTPPNRLGLRGLVDGNRETLIAEWVADCWNDSYNGAPTDGSVWTSGDCGKAVLRGGGPGAVTCRKWHTLEQSTPTTGIRVVRSPIEY